MTQPSVTKKVSKSFQSSLIKSERFRKKLSDLELYLSDSFLQVSHKEARAIQASSNLGALSLILGKKAEHLITHLQQVEDLDQGYIS